jgi:hypothetical protein
LQVVQAEFEEERSHLKAAVKELSETLRKLALKLTDGDEARSEVNDLLAKVKSAQV